jgi:hypothetical protein
MPLFAPTSLGMAFRALYVHLRQVLASLQPGIALDTGLSNLGEEQGSTGWVWSVCKEIQGGSAQSSTPTSDPTTVSH